MDPSFVDGRPSSPGGLQAWYEFLGGTSPRFEALGPLPGGRVLSRVFFMLNAHSGASVTYSLGLSLSGSPDPTLANFQAGRSLLRGNDQSVGLRPVFRRVMSARASGWGMMWPGLELRSGSEWLIVLWGATGAAEGGAGISLEFVWPGWYGGQFGRPPASPAEAAE